MLSKVSKVDYIRKSIEYAILESTLDLIEQERRRSL